MKAILPLILILSCVLGCSKKAEQNASQNLQIILFNLGDMDRQGIAKAIDQINECNPKLIAINAIFEEFSHTKEDSILLKAIKKAQNIILISNLDAGKIYHSDSSFLKASLDQGVLKYGYTKNNVDKYRTFLSWNNQILWTFPVTTLGHFDMDKAEIIINETKPNTDYLIEYQSNYLDYETITLSNLNCEKVSNKLVLIGYLGPTDEDTYSIPPDVFEGTEKLYSTIILANIIETMDRKSFIEAQSGAEVPNKK